LFQVALAAFNAKADLDVLYHPLLNLVYYTVMHGLVKKEVPLLISFWIAKDTLV
jgi:hypothetical protein